MSSPAGLALGTAQLGMPYGVANRGGAPTASDAERLLQAAHASGLRWVDTAPAYGESETRLGRFMTAHGLELQVVTKLDPLPPEADPTTLPAVVHAAVHRSLSALQRPAVEVLLLHHPRDLHRHGRALMDALVEQREAGRVQHLGLSIYEPAELELIDAYPELAAVQYPFNLFDRRFSAVVREAGAPGQLRLRFARSALLQGLLTLAPEALPEPLRAARPWLERLRLALRALTLEPSHAALAFARARSGADYVVVGAENAAQIQAWTRAPTELSPAACEALEAALLGVPEAVYDPRRWSAA